MKKRLLLLIVTFMACSLFAQERKVDFKIKDDATFYRADSDKNYYVFDFPGMDASELKTLFFALADKVHNYPHYHVDRYFELLVYDKDAETITFFVPYSEGGGNKSNLQFKVGLQFKDERVRINPPLFEDAGSRYPDEFIKASKYRKQDSETLANFIINNYLMFLNDAPVDLSNPAPIDKDALPEMKVVSGLRFLFSESDLVYKNISIPGMTKEEIKSKLYEIITAVYHGKNALGNDEIYPKKYEDGIYVSNYVRIAFSVFREGPAIFRYDMWYYCDDEVVQVYTPRIREVFTNNGWMSSAVWVAIKRIFDNDGDFNIKGEKMVNDMLPIMKRKVFDPIVSLYEFATTPQEQDEDW